MLKKVSYAVAIGAVVLVSVCITAVVTDARQGAKSLAMPGFDHPSPDY